jgi:CheY-like chemotaxis protein
MAPTILLVDDQHDILSLVHSALQTLQRAELEIVEATSGEDALLEVGRRKVDLLILDYRLPGMTGIELMHHVRARQPDVRVILITGITDRKARDEMLNAGAAAIFEKPIPLGDFLGTVERNLGLDSTIFPDESDRKAEVSRARFSDLLANFRQDLHADAVFLVNDRGLVVARAGDLRDRSLEVSLISALTATSSAGLKVSKSNRQEGLDQYYVFTGGDHELILMPVDPSYSLLLAGRGLADQEHLCDTIQAMIVVRNEVGRSLRSIGATGDLSHAARRGTGPKRKGKTGRLISAPTEEGMEALLDEAEAQKIKPEEVDAFWDQAAEKHAGKSSRPDAIPYEEARKLGLTPDKE